MAFESLSDRFASIIKKVKGQSRLTESNMDDILKEIRIALLEADVNFKVVKRFTERIKEKAIGEQVYLKLNPSQMVIKIVKDELVELLGSDNSELKFEKNNPTIIMMVGLQGTGKTTSAAKLANLFKKKQNKKVLLAACDVYRPAAIDQLITLGKSIGVDVFFDKQCNDAVKLASNAKEKAYNEHYDILIIDTAGRLEINDTLMDELNKIDSIVHPSETLLLVDAMSGQNAVNVTTAFHEKLNVTGIIMSKLDGDARGGSSLSIKELTNIPIKFSGVGEKIDDLDIFYPDRMADRILGMGDILTLVDKVKEEVEEKEMADAAKKLMDGSFTLDDMLKQMKQVQKIGSLGSIMKMIPGMPTLNESQKEMAKKEMNNLEAIINSMTKEERKHPEILKNSRKVRIAKGSGKTNADINRVLKKYEQMKQMMKMMKQYKKGGKLPPGMPPMF